MSGRHDALLLGIAHRDSTFDLVDGRDGPLWVGKCLHCDTALVIGPRGEALSKVTIEHILPRSHGGTDDWANLGAACRGCNHEKGVRHDKRRAGDPELAALVEKLALKRAGRWREPEAAPLRSRRR